MMEVKIFCVFAQISIKSFTQSIWFIGINSVIYLHVNAYVKQLKKQIVSFCDKDKFPDFTPDAQISLKTLIRELIDKRQKRHSITRITQRSLCRAN
jgi:hypothetical protein